MPLEIQVVDQWEDIQSVWSMKRWLSTVFLYLLWLTSEGNIDGLVDKPILLEGLSGVLSRDISHPASIILIEILH